MQRVSFLMVIVLALSPSCKMRQLSPPSELHVANGLTVGDQTTKIFGNDFNSVVKVAHKVGNPCSGTFISSNTLITAAHCITHGYYHYNFTRASHAYTIAPESFLSEPSLGGFDLAVLVFEKDLAPQISPLSNYRPHGGDSLVFVGFGADNSYNDVNNSIKRVGETKMWDPTAQEMSGRPQGIYFSRGVMQATKGVPAGTQVNGAHGDSGGPVFVVDKSKLPKLQATQLAGILGGVDTENRFTAIVDLQSSYSQKLFRCALLRDASVRIPGIAPETDPQNCTALRDLIPARQWIRRPLLTSAPIDEVIGTSSGPSHTKICLIDAGPGKVNAIPCTGEQLNQANGGKIVIDPTRGVFLNHNQSQVDQDKIELFLNKILVGYYLKSRQEFRLCYAAGLTTHCTSALHEDRQHPNQSEFYIIPKHPS